MFKKGEHFETRINRNVQTNHEQSYWNYISHDPFRSSDRKQKKAETKEVL